MNTTPSRDTLEGARSLIQGARSWLSVRSHWTQGAMARTHTYDSTSLAFLAPGQIHQTIVSTCLVGALYREQYLRDGGYVWGNFLGGSVHRIAALRYLANLVEPGVWDEDPSVLIRYNDGLIDMLSAWMDQERPAIVNRSERYSLVLDLLDRALIQLSRDLSESDDVPFVENSTAPDPEKISDGDIRVPVPRVPLAAPALQEYRWGEAATS